MRIVYCRDCKHICKPAGALYEPHPDSICLSNETHHRDYVIGVRVASKCKEINDGGNCLWFEAREEC